MGLFSSLGNLGVGAITGGASNGDDEDEYSNKNKLLGSILRGVGGGGGLLGGGGGLLGDLTGGGLMGALAGYLNPKKPKDPMEGM